MSEKQIIPAVNPSQEEMAELVKNIHVNYNFKVDVKPVTVRFKTTKDKESGVETKREALELAVPFPSVEGIIAILEAGGAQLALLVDAVEGVVMDQVRSLVSDDTSLNASNFPVDKVSWEFIANLPKATRRGGGIPKEVWDEFTADYKEVMLRVTGKSPTQIENQARILSSKFNTVKTNHQIIEYMVTQLEVYTQQGNMEDFSECVEFLLNKAEALLNISNEDLLEAL